MSLKCNCHFLYLFLFYRIETLKCINPKHISYIFLHSLLYFEYLNILIIIITIISYYYRCCCFFCVFFRILSYLVCVSWVELSSVGCELNIKSWRIQEHEERKKNEWKENVYYYLNGTSTDPALTLRGVCVRECVCQRIGTKKKTLKIL